MQIKPFQNSKYINSSELGKKISGEQLIFVSGCFDIIHFGHLYFFRKAKELAPNAKLLVVTHDDDSISMKKGMNRPVNKLEDRVELLCELESVDYVSSWIGWESIQDLVRDLKPAYLAVTNGEFSQKNVEKVVEEIGAKLLVIDKIDGASTSKIIEKVGF